jgi:hypothetical protein
MPERDFIVAVNKTITVPFEDYAETNHTGLMYFMDGYGIVECVAWAHTQAVLT